MDAERKEEILDLINKAGDSKNYEVKWDDKGIPQVRTKTEIKKRKKSRKSGLDFESRVRLDLEEKGWIVSKWPNQVELIEAKIIPAKQTWKFNPFRKTMMPSAQGTGFPDFIAFQKISEKGYNIIGVEVKVNGQLDREEREKCFWLLDNNVFNEIWVARKKKEGNRVLVEYINFKEKYLKEKDIN